MRISDWSSDVCSSDLKAAVADRPEVAGRRPIAAADGVRRIVGQRQAMPLGEGRDGGQIAALAREVHGKHGLNRAARLSRGAGRSEERRLGKEGVSRCGSRWCPYHSKKKKKTNH